MLGMAYRLSATRLIRCRASLTALIATVGIAALLLPAVASKRRRMQPRCRTPPSGWERRGALTAWAPPCNGRKHQPAIGCRPVYDSLVMKLRDGHVIPQLAISWENIDEVTWRYKLRPNVKYHNGEALTSAAVVQMLSFLLTDEGKSTRAGQAINGQARIASVRAIDDLTVELKTTVPNPLLPGPSRALLFRRRRPGRSKSTTATTTCTRSEQAPIVLSNGDPTAPTTKLTRTPGVRPGSPG